MPKSTVRKNSRKTAKQYRMVTFTNDLFEDDFTFPDFAQLTIGTIEALNDGNIGKVCAWLEAANVDKDSIEAFRDLTQEEIEGFIKDWRGGNLADLPK